MNEFPCIIVLKNTNLIDSSIYWRSILKIIFFKFRLSLVQQFQGMKKKLTISISLLIFSIITCKKDDFDEGDITIPNFKFPKTIVFEDSLSAYNIFQGLAANLIPTNDFELLELNSVLFTDFAYKQRLVKLPSGTKMTRLADNSIEFPNGTILSKTFFYYIDERDSSLGKNIIETRLMIKEDDKWNAASYRWNESQSEAFLQLNGSSKPISWLNSLGQNRSTLYKIPNENECMTCHQSNNSITHLGPTIQNLNKTVSRNGALINQLSHLQSKNLLENFSVNLVPSMVDYRNLNASISNRGRAYLALNCAHCHNPKGWDIPAEKDFDFRFETSLQGSGIPSGKDKISRNMLDGEMPFIGTTLMDDEGLALILDYLESL